MTTSNNNIINQINTKLVDYASLSSTALCSLTAAADSLKAAAVHSVPTLADLPDPTENAGRLIYVESIESYRYSNGVEWTAQYISIPEVYTQVWTWGSNNNIQLGDTTSRSSPVSIVGGFTNWCQVSAGNAHTAAVLTDGTLWSWGWNTNGQLGDDSVVTNISPVSVVGGFTNWCQVSAGGCHTAALRTDGTLWAWGINNCGQLGDNTIISNRSPVSVVGSFTDWSQVSAGNFHTAALRTDGTLWAWGQNTCGQLGDDSVVSKTSPVSVVGSFTDWCQVSAGYIHTAAVRTNGTVWTWGSNRFGMLGDDTDVSKLSPISVVGGFTDWCQVGAGRFHTAALRTNGTVWTWGSNSFARLGDNSTLNRSSPVSVVGGFTNWCQLSVGGYTTAAVRTDGTLWAWGRNDPGSLGDNTATNRGSPVSVVGGFTDWCQVAAGCIHSAAIRFSVQGFNTP